jgi:fimbrial isopeptide formation D2 family protein/LPXTG-motif cell wall-anchored protein
MKKLVSLVLALCMVLMVGAAFAQSVPNSPADADNSTITINNPARGETYSLYKLFDATVSTSGNIAYQGSVPTNLANYFVADDNGNISPKEDSDIVDKDNEGNITGTHMTDGLKAALEAWAKSSAAASSKVIEAVSEGDELVFTGLPYGYYVMITTHKSDAVGDAEAKAAITVASTKPSAAINDKNKNVPTADKVVNDENISIGDKVIYTATFDAPNYMAKKGSTTGESEQVVSYTITDTLPAFLSDVLIKKVEIQQPGVSTNVVLDGFTDSTFDATTKSITVKWVSENIPTTNHKYTSLYKAGSKIIVTYEAVLTASANVGADNTNVVSIMPNVDRGNGPEPYQDEDEWHDDATVYTHAVALQKKANSKEGDNLAGAEFSFKGLIVTGVPGFYTVVSYDPTSSADGTIMKCDANGKLIIAGIDADSATAIKLTGTETTAPVGFNKIVGTFEIETTVMSQQTTTTHGNRTTYYDADGNIVSESVTGGSSITRKEITAISDIPPASINPVVNKSGTELPSTGGIGTTLFYIIGGVLLIGAGVILVARRKAHE